VTVTGDSQISAQPKNYIVSVSGVTEPGEYEGRIEVLVDGAADAALRIPLKLTAKVQPVVAPDPATPSFVMKLASDCSRLTKAVLGSDPCRGEQAVFLKSTAGALATNRSLELIAVDEQKQALSDNQAHLSLSGNRLVLSVVPAAVPAGHYTGRAVVQFDGVKTPLEVPVDIQSRIGPSWPLVAIIAGILIGWLAKVMRERGDRQAELRAQFNRVLSRVHALPPESRQALLPLQTIADDSIDHQTLERAATDVANYETGSEILATLERYRGHPNFAQANGQLPNRREDAIRDHIVVGNLPGAKDVLEQIRIHLVPAAAALVGGAGVGGAGIGGHLASVQVAIEKAWNIFIQYIARPLMQLLLLIGLAYVGLSTLYIDGSATFGVRPLAELFALFAWGLSADVASRTLANLRGGSR
jgi:hypothetical protein